jgi:hypothetical protein
MYHGLQGRVIVLSTHFMDEAGKLLALLLDLLLLCMPSDHKCIPVSFTVRSTYNIAYIARNCIALVSMLLVLACTPMSSL